MTELHAPTCNVVGCTNRCQPHLYGPKGITFYAICRRHLRELRAPAESTIVVGPGLR